ncbi:hypothetical protein [Thiorhodococcus fuscus]|uniref:SLATT domain-containing protein n=1 Tax=Thiorhodococcus fuscus TaxID=527200 RepID=A0ABW4Y784_9GAMM
MSENDDYLWNRREQVLYRVQLSVLYHRKRERFLAFWDRTITAVAILGGSSALASLGGDLYVKLAAGAVAVTSTIGLVFGLADRARRHGELARQFLEIEGTMIRQGERDFTEQDVNGWDARVREIETSEPPTLGALVVACQNELAQTLGETDSIHRLGWWRRLTMHLFDARSFPPQPRAS